MPSAGRWTTGICSGRAPSPGICWNAPARSPAAISPIPATRMSRISRGSAFRSAKSARTAALVITKVAGSGGAVTAQTCKEQLLYEVHDPARYIQPDVVADFSQVTVEEIAPDRVRVSGGRGTQRTDTLKVSVGYVDSYIGEGQISYAGPGALARGRLALEIVRERLELTGVAASELRFDLIGVDALHGAAARRARQRALRGARARRRPHREPARGGADRQRGRDALHQRPGRPAAARANRRARWSRWRRCCCRANWRSRRSGFVEA